MQNRKKVVITGATGAIGRALIEVSIAAGYDVLAIIHRSSARAGELERIEHCRVLMLNQDEYGTALDEIPRQGIETDGYTLFFHLAWMASFGKGREDLDLQIENIRAALAAVRLAKALNCSVFTGIGSQAEYGRCEGILSPETPAFPDTGYGVSKLCAGQMTRLECEKHGLRHIWCRVLSVYGPYDREQTLISTAVRQMLLDEETSFTPCDQLWDYIYSVDAARAILLAAEKGRDGQIYIIGSGKARPLREYIETVAVATGYSKEIGFGKRPYNDKQVMFLQADTSALQEIGFHQTVSFKEGIKRTIEWRNTN